LKASIGWQDLWPFAKYSWAMMQWNSCVSVNETAALAAARREYLARAGLGMTGCPRVPFGQRRSVARRYLIAPQLGRAFLFDDDFEYADGNAVGRQR
jgi:hypothetical protein